MIYVLTEGEYSDFTILGVYEGPPGVDVDKLRLDFIREHYDDPTKVVKRENKYPGGRVERYAHVPGSALEDYIVEKGGLKKVEYLELHSGGGFFGPKEVPQ